MRSIRKAPVVLVVWEVNHDFNGLFKLSIICEIQKGFVNDLKAFLISVLFELIFIDCSSAQTVGFPVVSAALAAEHIRSDVVCSREVDFDALLTV